MQVTAKNLDKTLERNGYLVVVRIPDTGGVHYGKFRKDETVSYGDVQAFSSAERTVESLIPNGTWDGAVIKYAPHSGMYTVKRGEIL